jgi:hypothetical protein
MERAKHLEREASHELLNDCGQASHPLALMDNIVRESGNYREILSFWQPA